MKANELRIGNYVLASAPKEVIYEVRNPSIVQANYHHFNDIGRGNKEWVYEPIPLTEDWLLKLGFHKDIHGSFLKGAFEIGYEGMDFVNNVKTIKIANAFYIKIKHVHQLQNLYFALTQTDLIIKND